MALPRLHLFEFNDTAWAPVAVREALIEALSHALDHGHMLQGLALPFAQFLDRTGATEVLDLCAGAGGPAAVLARELRAAGRRPPRFLETDLQPHPETWAQLKAADPEAIDFVPGSVDATAVPPELARGRVRLVINGLHHLRPPLAQAVLRAACADSPGVFVAEGFERNPLRFLPIAPRGIVGLAGVPLRSPRRRLAKALLLPLSLVAAAWDGVVSTLRVYTEAELRAMVEPAGDAFEWSYGTWDFGLGGRSYWFAGVRRR
jgi:hypothetical protein